MTTIDDAVAAQATTTGQTWTSTSEAMTEEIADCFPSRDSRLLVQDATRAMLMAIERRNCWRLAEALGHTGPHRISTSCPAAPGTTRRPGTLGRICLCRVAVRLAYATRQDRAISVGRTNAQISQLCTGCGRLWSCTDYRAERRHCARSSLTSRVTHRDAGIAAWTF